MGGASALRREWDARRGGTVGPSLPYWEWIARPGPATLSVALRKLLVDAQRVGRNRWPALSPGAEEWTGRALRRNPLCQRPLRQPHTTRACREGPGVSESRPGRRGRGLRRGCRGRLLSATRCLPVVRQEVTELPDRRRRQARQHVPQVRPRLDTQPLTRGREAEEHLRRLTAAG